MEVKAEAKKELLEEEEEEKLYRAWIEVIVKAKNVGEVNKQVYARIIWINDILEIEQENLEHLLTEKAREETRQTIIKHLRRLEK